MRCKTIETSIFHVNNNNFTDPLIIGTFEKRAPGHLLDWFSVVPKQIHRKIKYIEVCVSSCEIAPFLLE